MAESEAEPDGRSTPLPRPLEILARPRRPARSSSFSFTQLEDHQKNVDVGMNRVFEVQTACALAAATPASRSWSSSPSPARLPALTLTCPPCSASQHLEPVNVHGRVSQSQLIDHHLTRTRPPLFPLFPLHATHHPIPTQPHPPQPLILIKPQHAQRIKHIIPIQRATLLPISTLLCLASDEGNELLRGGLHEQLGVRGEFEGGGERLFH